MFRKTPVVRALAVAFCGTASMLSAQQVLAQAASTTLERVEITGSNIRRTDAETASPVQVITKQEIDQAGKGTVAEYLQTLTADGQGSVPFTYGRGFSGATSSGISLRGLGANATLVLINGRRVTSAVLADDAQRSYTDLNQIPLDANALTRVSYTSERLATGIGLIPSCIDHDPRAHLRRPMVMMRQG